MAGAIQILNYTPHTVHVYGLAPGGGPIAEYPSVGRARVGLRKLASEVAGCPVCLQAYGAVEGLPPPRPGTFYVVSRIVETACPDRGDLLVPGPPVRDAAGEIVGCRGLSLTERRMTNDGPAVT